METKLAIMLIVIAFVASSSIFHSPAEAYPTIQKTEEYLYAYSNREVYCLNIKDGEKIPSQTSCSEFYECDHGVAYLFQCANMTDGERLYFDPKWQRCNWPSEVDCEVASTEPSTTTLVNESSEDAKPKQYERLQRIFSPIENASVDCSQAENGDRIPSPTSCSEYFICVMGNTYLYKCPLMVGGGRLYYDTELGVCNWPWLVDCEITTTESPSTTTIVTTPSNTTTIEPVSTTIIQKNSTTLKPATDATIVSIKTTKVEEITSQNPQTSTQQNDSETTSEATSSHPLSTTTKQQASTLTIKASTE